MSNNGIKYDEDKPPMALLSTVFLEEVSKVLAFGANKYAVHNWRKGIEYSRLISAAMRHITAFNNGQDLDTETGLSHIAHASCCLMFLLEQQIAAERSIVTQYTKDMDDRYKVHNSNKGSIIESGDSNIGKPLKIFKSSEEACNSCINRIRGIDNTLPYYLTPLKDRLSSICGSCVSTPVPDLGFTFSKWRSQRG